MIYQTIKQNCIDEITEKKSRFICQLFYVENKQEAEDKIKQIRKKYYDSKHNCFAYRIYDMESDSIITKMSDDGEPSGTAGAPMLAILNGNNLINVLAVVTRYFGGILLGTGGLVRAYQGAVQKTLDKAILSNVTKGSVYQISLPYSHIEQFKYFFNINNIHIVKIEYSENIKYLIEIGKNDKEKILSQFEEKKFELLKIEHIGEKMIILD